MEQAFQFVEQLQSGDAIAALAVGGVSFGQLVLLALIVIVLAILLRSARSRWQRSVAMSRDSVRERYEKLKSDRTATREVDKVLVELDQLARQVHGRLDTQLVKLEILINDADQRIDKLSRLVRAAQGTEALDITLDSEEPYDDSPPAAATSGDAPASASLASVTLGTDKGKSDGGESGPHGPIYRLADRGMSPLEIAQQVGRTTGEIELILSLRKAKAQLADPAAAATSVRPDA